MVDSDELIKFLFYNINFLNVTYSTYLILECMIFIRERILGIVTFLSFFVAGKQEDSRGNSISCCNWIFFSGFPNCIHGKQASRVCTLG